MHNTAYMNRFNSGWYLIYTKPRHEKKVQVRLKEMELDCYVPMTRKLHSWHDRKKYVDEPLFPSYVFIYLKDLQSYYKGTDAEGAVCYVKIGKEIAKVSDSTIENIRLLVEKSADFEVTANRFQPGEELLIQTGPLTGLSCEMVQFNGNRKILVRVHLLQRNLLAVLPSEYLMSAFTN